MSQIAASAGGPLALYQKCDCSHEVNYLICVSVFIVLSSNHPPPLFFHLPLLTFSSWFLSPPPPLIFSCWVIWCCFWREWWKAFIRSASGHTDSKSSPFLFTSPLPPISLFSAHFSLPPPHSQRSSPPSLFLPPPPPPPPSPSPFTPFSPPSLLHFHPFSLPYHPPPSLSGCIWCVK